MNVAWDHRRVSPRDCPYPKLTVTQMQVHEACSQTKLRTDRYGRPRLSSAQAPVHASPDLYVKMGLIRNDPKQKREPGQDKLTVHLLTASRSVTRNTHAATTTVQTNTPQSIKQHVNTCTNGTSTTTHMQSRHDNVPTYLQTL